MRNFRFTLIALLALLFVAPFASRANAQVSFGLAIGPGAYGPPVCEWGYYNYYPYACAPYGYYGPEWFNGGVFIGVGPWYGWTRRDWAGRRAWVAPRGEFRGYGSFRGDGPGAYTWGRGYAGPPARGFAGGGNRGFSGGPVRGYGGGGSRGGGRR